MAVALHERARQAELGNTVLEHTSDLGTLLEHRHAATGLGELNRRGNARRARADHRDLFAARLRLLEHRALQIG